MPNAIEQLARGIGAQLSLSPVDREYFIAELISGAAPGRSGFARLIAEALESGELDCPLSLKEIAANLAQVKPFTDALEIVCAEDRPAMYGDEGTVRRLDPQTDDLATFCQAADLAACYELLHFMRAGVSESTISALDHLPSMVAVAQQLEPTLRCCECHPPHTDEFQVSWRVLPALYEDAQQTGLFLMAPQLTGDMPMESWLGSAQLALRLHRAATTLMTAGIMAEAPLTNRPPELDAIVSAETLTAAPALPKLCRSLPHLLQLQPIAHDDWPERFARVQAAVTEPLLLEGGVTQVDGYRAAGFDIPLLRRTTSASGAMVMAPTGKVASSRPAASAAAASRAEP